MIESWESVAHVPGPGTSEVQDAIGISVRRQRRPVRIIITGSGGTGGEILRNVSNIPCVELTIVDFDHVSETNLNRQSLFVEKDVGSPKAAAAAAAVRPTCELFGSTVTSLHMDATKLSIAELSQYHIVVIAVDSHEVRRSLVRLALAASAVAEAAGGQPIPVVDCGSTGLHGHCFTFIRGITPCIDCATVRPLYADGEPVPAGADDRGAGLHPAACVAAARPRSVAHLASHAVAQWEADAPRGRIAAPSPAPTELPLQRGAIATPPCVPYDIDDPADVEWLGERARTHAAMHDLPLPTNASVRRALDATVPASCCALAVVGGVAAGEVTRLATGWTASAARPGEWLNITLRGGGGSSRVALSRDRACAACHTYRTSHPSV